MSEGGLSLWCDVFCSRLIVDGSVVGNQSIKPLFGRCMAAPPRFYDHEVVVTAATAASTQFYETPIDRFPFHIHASRIYETVPFRWYGRRAVASCRARPRPKTISTCSLAPPPTQAPPHAAVSSRDLAERWHPSS